MFNERHQCFSKTFVCYQQTWSKERKNKSVTTYVFAFWTYKSYKWKSKSQKHMIKGSRDFKRESLSQ